MYVGDVSTLSKAIKKCPIRAWPCHSISLTFGDSDERERLNDALKLAMRNRDTVAISTLRLILAALKDRDIAARTSEGGKHISDQDIMHMLQTMVKQRRESLEIYQKAGRDDLVEQETAEIQIITQFLPTMMSDADMEIAIGSAIEKTAATQLKDMGQVMQSLRQDYAGQMDFSKAAAVIKAKLV